MDPIADMINSLKLAGRAGFTSASVPHSNLKFGIAKLLESEGYLKSVTKAGKKNRQLIQCELSYQGDAAKIAGVKRVSKPSRRVYVELLGLPRYKSTRGTAVVSTSKGLKTVKEAIADKVGGELLFTIWS